MGAAVMRIGRYHSVHARAKGETQMRDLNELNINEGGKPVTRPQPTSDQISFVESLIGVKLPASYTEFLTFSNGGHPELDTFYFEIEGLQDEWNVNYFFCISSNPNAYGDVVWNYKRYQTMIPEKVLPIADDGSGNLICLDLAKPKKESVVLWVHDAFEHQLRLVADSFEEFIDSLAKNPNYI